MPKADITNLLLHEDLGTAGPPQIAVFSQVGLREILPDKPQDLLVHGAEHRVREVQFRVLFPFLFEQWRGELGKEDYGPVFLPELQAVWNGLHVDPGKECRIRGGEVQEPAGPGFLAVSATGPFPELVHLPEERPLLKDPILEILSRVIESTSIFCLDRWANPRKP